MRNFYICLGIAACIAFGGFLSLACLCPGVVVGYQTNARTPLFAAFVTLGSFLLTLKTTVLQRLKDGFDSEEHKAAYIYGGKKGEYYSSLRNMSSAIAACVFCSLLTSTIQMSAGFVNHPIAFALCAAAATTTLLLVLYLWREISATHKLWLNKIEKEVQALLNEEE